MKQLSTSTGRENTQSSLLKYMCKLLNAMKIRNIFFDIIDLKLLASTYLLIATQDLLTTESTVSQAPLNIQAHKSELACLSVNREGTLLATASHKGTLIRVWDTARRVLLAELRRGSDPATLYWWVKIEYKSMCYSFLPSFSGLLPLNVT